MGVGELLNSEQAADWLLCKPQTLGAWRMRKEGPAYVKVGRKVFYRPRDLDKWLENRTVESPDS